MVNRILLASTALALGACASSERMPPRLYTRSGPAVSHVIRRVVALPSTCGTFDLTPTPATAEEQARLGSSTVLRHLGTCATHATAGVDQALRAALEFGGFSVIDSEKVNALTATRQEIIQRSSHREQRQDLPTTTSESANRSVEVIGARFGDATPREQEAIIAELGATGLVQARIAIGAGVGLGTRRTAIVQVRLLEMPARQLAWARRCEIEVGGLMERDEVAMERGIRCAIEGVVAK